ncbi:hypothetical protein, partial [Escherichia coli]|uniref:hypothetical protein n=1 Tax=Escherichia coli TaxID=562 RepID=UPI0032E37AD3
MGLVGGFLAARVNARVQKARRKGMGHLTADAAAYYSLFSERNFIGGCMENTAPVLLVTNRMEWEKQYGQYKRKAKLLRAIYGLLVFPCIGALAYLA